MHKEKDTVEAIGKKPRTKRDDLGWRGLIQIANDYKISAEKDRKSPKRQ